MGFTNGPGAAAAPPDTDTGSRTPSTGALLASMAVAAGLAVVDLHMPYLAGWALNTAVILGASAAVCLHKRSRRAWACAAVLAVICAVMPFLALAGLMGFASPVYLVAVAAVTAAWYWLLRFGKVRPAASPEVQHVVHHHVVHGAQGAVPAAVPVPAAPVTVPGSVVRPAVTAGARRHLAGMVPVLQRLGAPREER